MNNKKGAELSLNVIIIAILVLIVLVVLSLVFTNKISPFTKETDSHINLTNNTDVGVVDYFSLHNISVVCISPGGKKFPCTGVEVGSGAVKVHCDFGNYVIAECLMSLDFSNYVGENSSAYINSDLVAEPELCDDSLEVGC